MKKDFTNQILDTLRSSGSKGFTARELCDKLRVKRQYREEFFLSLHKLVKNGTVREKKGRYRANKPEKLITAKIISIKEGFGFAGSDELERDIFIPGRALQGAMPGDTVLIRKTQGRGELPEGEVVRISVQSEQPFSGVFRKQGGRCEIVPDSGSKIPVKVAPADALGARDGDKVLAHVTSRGNSHFTHKAAVTEVFGKATSAAACSEAILAASGITKQFSDEVLKFADHISSKGITDKDMQSRLDLRYDLIFTIDGADTKDIDDAVSLEKHEDGWHLGVHIADVSHYVRPNTPLDVEAFERGTSVYYANSVVPMLPPALSNGICSLNPQEDRLAFSALLSLDKTGKLIGYRFEKSIIRSRVKGVYSEINQILSNTADDTIMEKYDGLIKSICDMRELAGILSKRRMSRGGLNLQSTESKILVGGDGRAEEIVERVQGVSEGIIEEFMLTANEAAASLAMERMIPFVYRVHEHPSPEKIENLCTLLDALAVDCSELKKHISSGALARILNAVNGTELQLLVNNQILRSMAKAKYSEVNKGHFGLVLENYAHFTSPIRRYPDLTIHRIMTSLLSGMDDTRLKRKYGNFVKISSEQSSNREQRAMTVERDCEDCYKAEYMTRHIGECFDGVITSVTSHGIYVELSNTIEGMIRIDSLPQGNYDYDGMVELVETSSNTRYRVGKLVRVQVAGADVSAGNIDFVLAQ
ncbi:ribonuclease R [Hydrogenoanaerobacterium sp.]|uniref:ribonuclease R n=1 Tax=Hydrogenoanaerobacterium sp. TaxID=2953763 RepID=UPI0028A0AB98|nr:ribonuclease R [Hydrogenoanaerobacterium sp.]